MKFGGAASTAQLRRRRFDGAASTAKIRRESWGVWSRRCPAVESPPPLDIVGGGRGGGVSAGLRIKVTIDDDEAPRCQVTPSPRDRKHSRVSFQSDKSSRITPTIYLSLISVQTHE